MFCEPGFFLNLITLSTVLRMANGNQCLTMLEGNYLVSYTIIQKIENDKFASESESNTIERARISVICTTRLRL